MEIGNYLIDNNYRTKEYISKVCSFLIEDLLKKTFDEEDPPLTAAIKESRSTQTDYKILYKLMMRSKKWSAVTGMVHR